MKSIFPNPILELPEADLGFEGVRAYLAQGSGEQILFMQFDKDVDLPEHAHGAQWGIVLEGEITLTIDGNKRTYIKGDRYYIAAGIKHSGKIHAGYADITFFNEAERYKVKN
jgi:quercetin dioxygenase-like cupin family protein